MLYIYFFSKTEKKIIEHSEHFTGKYFSFSSGEYLILNFFEDCTLSSHAFGVNSDNYLFADEKLFSTEIDNGNSKQIVFDLNSYNFEPYVMLGNYKYHYYYCTQYNTFEDYVKHSSTISYPINTDYHILKLREYPCPDDEPYLAIFLKILFWN